MQLLRIGLDSVINYLKQYLVMGLHFEIRRVKYYIMCCSVKLLELIADKGNRYVVVWVLMLSLHFQHFALVNSFNLCTIRCLSCCISKACDIVRLAMMGLT